MEIEIKNDIDNNNITLQFFPFDFLCLSELLEEFPKAKINKIHAILFSASDGDNDVYIKDDNFIEVMGKINIVTDVVNFFKTQDKEYTINKLDMNCGDINVFFDDDALLIISFPKEKINMDFSFAKKIFDSFLPLR